MMWNFYTYIMSLNLFIIYMLLAAVFVCLLTLGKTQEFLKNVPISFKLNGLTTYVPSTGGVAIQGYQITVGFGRYSWLGVMFQTLTSTNNYDTLILQRTISPSTGVYTCTLKDYYVSSGRPDTLQIDTTTSNDKTTTSTSDSNTFTLTFPRTTGSTNGQDWEGGQFVNICFFTSDSTFTQSTWSRQYQVCYGYQITNYVSTYRGSYLGNMNFQGVSSGVYGGVYGPYLQMQLYWHRTSPTIANTSNLIIRIGNQISADIGYDYYICGSGDYYGQNPGSLNKDLLYSGYDNGACTFSTSPNSVSLSYSRDVYTFDSFDVTITQTINICVIGTQMGCAQLTLPKNYPIMTVDSALTIWEHNLTPKHLLALVLLLFLTHL